MNKFRVTTLNGVSNLLVSRFDFESLSYAIKVAEETEEGYRVFVSAFNYRAGGWQDILCRHPRHRQPEGFGVRDIPATLQPIF
jgi:hypothetical protein